MKRSRIMFGFIVLVLFFGSMVPSGMASVTDVSPDHWAYQAVVSLVNRGFLATYEDGSFQGTNAVDRYTLAVTVARILDEIEAGRIIGSQSDADLLRDLTTEFRAELVQFYTDKNLITTTLEETQKQGYATEERLNNVVANQAEMLESLTRLKADIMEEASKTAASIRDQQNLLNQHGQTLEITQTEIESQQAEIKTQQERINELQSAVIKLEELLMLQELDLDRLQAWSGEMQNWSGEKDAVFAMLDLELSQTLKELEAQIQDLSGEIDALDQDHQTELDQLSKQVADLITMIAQTDGLVVRNHEQLKVQVDSLSQRNQQLERDLQNIAVLLEQEKQNRNLQSEGLNSKIAELSTQLEFLSTQVGVSEEELAALSKKISDEIAVQMNAAIIRERGLSGTVAELEAEFDAYKIATQAEIKSAKSTAMIAIAAAAIAVVIGFIQ